MMGKEEKEGKYGQEFAELEVDDMKHQILDLQAQVEQALGLFKDRTGKRVVVQEDDDFDLVPRSAGSSSSSSSSARASSVGRERLERKEK